MSDYLRLIFAPEGRQASVDEFENSLDLGEGVWESVVEQTGFLEGKS